MEKRCTAFIKKPNPCLVTSLETEIWITNVPVRFGINLLTSKNLFLNPYKKFILVVEASSILGCICALHFRAFLRAEIHAQAFGLDFLIQAAPVGLSTCKEGRSGLVNMELPGTSQDCCVSDCILGHECALLANHVKTEMVYHEQVGSIGVLSGLWGPYLEWTWGCPGMLTLWSLALKL